MEEIVVNRILIWPTEQGMHVGFAVAGQDPGLRDGRYTSAISFSQLLEHLTKAATSDTVIPTQTRRFRFTNWTIELRFCSWADYFRPMERAQQAFPDLDAAPPNPVSHEMKIGTYTALGLTDAIKDYYRSRTNQLQTEYCLAEAGRVRDRWWYPERDNFKVELEDQGAQGFKLKVTAQTWSGWLRRPTGRRISTCLSLLMFGTGVAGFALLGLSWATGKPINYWFQPKVAA